MTQHTALDSLRHYAQSVVADERKQAGKGRSARKHDANAPKLELLRRALSSVELDALRFRFWFAQAKPVRSLDDWRRDIDMKMLEDKPNGSTA